MNTLTNLLTNIFPSDGIYEVILGSNGEKPNLAPVGIVKEGNVLKSKIYKDTLTFSNLLKKSKCSINIVQDPNLFFDSFFGSIEVNSFLDDVPIIEKGVTLIASCKYEKIEDPTYFFYEVTNYKKYTEYFTAFNRGNSMLIDLLVHVSRLDIYSKQEIEKYLPIIRYEIEIIRKTSPNSIKNISKIMELFSQKGLKI